MPLRTTEVHGPNDVRAFFDRLAPLYRDCHGPADRLLRYRLGIIDGLLEGAERDYLLEIGCGTGLHLLALAEGFRRLRGVDLSLGMIERAERSRREHPLRDRIRFGVDAAETLASVGDGEADAVLCVGAFEHMPDKPAVLRQVRRALKPGGAFLCLTPNADWVWYAAIAPRLGLPVTHLSSDRFVGRHELTSLLEASGLKPEAVGHWTFIPRGDMPRGWAHLLAGLDLAGRMFRCSWLRGGLYCRAVKP